MRPSQRRAGGKESCSEHAEARVGRRGRRRPSHGGRPPTGAREGGKRLRPGKQRCRGGRAAGPEAGDNRVAPGPLPQAPPPEEPGISSVGKAGPRSLSRGGWDGCVATRATGKKRFGPYFITYTV